MSHCCRCALLFALLTGMAHDARAQSSTPMATDRPDFTEAATVVGTKVWQVETGVLGNTDSQSGLTSKDLSAPNMLLRLGVNSRLELRAGMQGLVGEHSGRPRASWQSSVSDLEVGTKYQLAHQHGLGLDLAILAFVTMPIGGSSANADPTVKFAWGRDVGRASVGGNLNWSAPTTPDDKRVRVLEGSVTVSHGLWGPWSGFLEAVGRDIDETDASAAWTGNTGITRLLGNDLQVDLHVGRGLTDAATNWTIGAGMAYRFRR